jgi:hypothetical protein
MLASMRAKASTQTQDRHKTDETQE